MRDAIAQGRSGLRPLGPHDFGANPMAEPLDTWVGRVDGLDQPCRRAGCTGTAATTAWPGGACRRTALRTTVGAAVRATAPAGWPWCSARPPPASAPPRTPTRRSTPPAYLPGPAGQPGPAHPAFAHRLRAGGPGPAPVRAQTISTACSSSAKAFASRRAAAAPGPGRCGSGGRCGQLVRQRAVRLPFIAAGLGRSPADPSTTRRRGISIGEAAGLRPARICPSGGLQLLGHGESSDAHHLSAPDPDGAWAPRRRSIRLLSPSRAWARGRGGLTSTCTAPPHPRTTTSEARLIARRFAPWHADRLNQGHDRPHPGRRGGAGRRLQPAGAGASGVLPGTVNTRGPVEPGMAELPAAVQPAANSSVRACRASHAFAFGGSNCRAGVWSLAMEPIT